MSRTKIAGYLLIAVSIMNTLVDILNGGGFEASSHLNNIVVALNGAGFVFLREAIAKLGISKK